MSKHYVKIEAILNGHNDITDHVKSIFDGDIYDNDEISAFLGSMYDVVNQTENIRDLIFFDFLEKDKKYQFISDHLSIKDTIHLTSKNRVMLSPKQSEVIEFIKRDFYCAGLSELYEYMHTMYKLSPESFVAVWSIAITNGTFADLLNTYTKKDIVPLRKRKRKR